MLIQIIFLLLVAGFAILKQKLVDFFSRESDSKDFRLHGQYGLCHNYSAHSTQNQSQTILNRWIQSCFNKMLLAKGVQDLTQGP